jgi:decaprenyl-phosphate phosphoribosyltransferase
MNKFIITKVQLFKLLRISHWVKNIFIFLPLFFAGELLNPEKITSVIWGFLFFSLAASSIYIINDYIDREKDALHPVKKLRPLAAGAISAGFALAISVVLIFAAIVGSFYIDPYFCLILVIYHILNLAYSFGLKNLPIIDVFIIAIGFILRVQAGAVLGNVPLSMWLNLMVFLLALFMALGKRRDDVILQAKSGIEIRKSIDGYNMEFLNMSITLVCAVILVCYLMYTISPEVDARLRSSRLYYTSLFVFMGILRYLQLIFVNNDSGSPVKIIFKDRFLQVILLLWILSFYFLIYVKDTTI